MPAINTKVQICNAALLKLGAKEINNLDTDVTPEAVYCRTAYDRIRENLLRAHPWSFARRNATLAQITGDSGDETLPNKFAVPNGCLRILRVLPETARYEVNARIIITDSATLQIKYIASIDDPTEFDALFAEVFILRLAAEISLPLTQSSDLANFHENKAMMKFQEAKSVDSQENNCPIQPEARSSWLEARN